MHKRKSFIYFLSMIATLSVFVLFSNWFLKHEKIDLMPTLASLIVTILALLIIPKTSESLERIFFIDKSEIITGNYIPPFLDGKLTFFVGVITLVWVFIVNIAVIIFARKNGVGLDFQESLENLMTFYLRADKYLFVSENWYNTEFLDDYKSVFPLYSIILGICKKLGAPYLLGMIFNNLLAVLSGLLIFQLTIFDYEDQVGFKSLIYFLFFPSNFFLILPLHLGLFFFLSLLYVFLVRRRNWLLSFFVGYLAGLTDPYAIILFFFALIEFISMLREETADKRIDEAYIDIDKPPIFFIEKLVDMKFYLNYGLKALTLLGIPFSILFFALLNKKTHLANLNIISDFEKYINGEKSYFFSNAFSLAYDFARKTNPLPNISEGSLLPTMCMMIFILLILLFGANKIRASYLIYSLIYFFVIYGADNVFASNKYSVMIFPIIFISAYSADNVIKGVILGVIYFVFSFLYFLSFLNGYPVY